MKSNAKNLAKLMSLIGIVFGLMVFVFAARAEDHHETDSLYIGDGGDDSVKRFDAHTGEYLGTLVPSQSDGLRGPRGLLRQGGNLLVVNQNVNQPFNGEVLRFNRNNGAFKGALIACRDDLCDPDSPFAPRGIIKGPHSTLFVADNVGPSFDFRTQGSVKQYDFKTGQFTRNLDTSGFTDNFFPRGVVFGPDGKLYVSITGDLDPGNPPANPNPNFDPITGYILRFNAHTGKFVDVFTSNLAEGCAADLHRPEGLVFGPDEKLYVTSFRADANDTDKVLVFNGKTGKCLDQIDLDQVGGPRAFAQAILFGPKGRLFVPITGNGPDTGSVRRYNVKTKTFEVFVPSGGPLQSPWYLTFGETDPSTLEYDD